MEGLPNHNTHSGVLVDTRLRLGTVYLPLRSRDELPAIEPFIPQNNHQQGGGRAWPEAMGTIATRGGEPVCPTLTLSHRHLITTRHCLTRRLGITGNYRLAHIPYCSP